MEELRSWLNGQGYPFELRVGRALRDAGWRLQHGRLYADSVSGKTREIDIHARFSRGRPDPAGAVTIALAVECKRSLSKPWVVFSAEQDGSALHQLPSSLFPGTLAGLAALEAFPSSDDLVRTFAIGDRLGYGIVKGFSDNKPGDPTSAYSACLGAVSAAVAFNARTEEFSLRAGPRWPFIELAAPVVVLDGQLYEFYVGEDGTEHLEAVNSSFVTTQHPARPAEIVNAIIVTAEHLPAFLQQATKDAAQLVDVLMPKVRSIVTRVEGMQAKQSGASPAT